MGCVVHSFISPLVRRQPVAWECCLRLVRHWIAQARKIGDDVVDVLGGERGCGFAAWPEMAPVRLSDVGTAGDDDAAQSLVADYSEVVRAGDLLVR